jgi:hypothetical protein
VCDEYETLARIEANGDAADQTLEEERGHEEAGDKDEARAPSHSVTSGEMPQVGDEGNERPPPPTDPPPPAPQGAACHTASTCDGREGGVDSNEDAFYARAYGSESPYDQHWDYSGHYSQGWCPPTMPTEPVWGQAQQWDDGCSQFESSGALGGGHGGGVHPWVTPAVVAETPSVVGSLPWSYQGWHGEDTWYDSGQALSVPPPPGFPPFTAPPVYPVVPLAPPSPVPYPPMGASYGPHDGYCAGLHCSRCYKYSCSMCGMRSNRMMGACWYCRGPW